MSPMNPQSEQVDFTIDAIAMKRHIQEQMYEDTKGMNPEEFIAYMHRRIANSQFAKFLERDASLQPQLKISSTSRPGS